jgi:biotin carboxylase
MAERNLSEAEAYRLLESAGIRVVPHRVVATPDELTSAEPLSGPKLSGRAAGFGFPVVLKIASAASSTSPRSAAWRSISRLRAR